LVDNGSSDSTVNTANEVWNKNPITKFTIVTESKLGLMNARIKGVESAQYDILSFIDDDNWVDVQWISKVFAIMKSDSQIAACGGSSEGVFESAPPSWFHEFSRSYAVGSQQEKNGYVEISKGYLWGAGLTVRKKAWDQLFKSGFKSLLQGRSGNTLTAGEDSELCYSWVLSGWKLWYDDSLKLKHFIPQSRMNLDYLTRMYEGFGKAETILTIYRNFIKGTKAVKYSWGYRTINAFSNLFLTFLQRIISSGEEKIKKRIQWKHNSAFAFELIRNRIKYTMARKQITSFFAVKD
jgi:glycosyltransferase involved in cell wall biosynthesis